MNGKESCSSLSLIVPVYNEVRAVEPFLEKVQKVLGNLTGTWEIVFVNDGSTDDTLQILLKKAADSEHIRIVNLSRNFGKEAALTAGLDNAEGDAVIPIDIDLQDPPELILEFVSKWKEGYDIVYGIREDRQSDSVVKRTTADMFYRLFNKISTVDIPQHVGDFRLMDRRVVEVLKQLPERNRFMKGLFSWVGFKSIGIPYSRPKRSAGISYWSYWRLWNFALDGVIGFSAAPLRIWTYVGLLVALFAFLYALFIIFKVLITGIDVPGYASIMTVVLFFGGMQLLLFGILGEYIGRLFDEVKRRPIYVIEGIYGGEKSSENSSINHFNT